MPTIEAMLGRIRECEECGIKGRHPFVMNGPILCDACAQTEALREARKTSSPAVAKAIKRFKDKLAEVEDE